MDKHGILVCDIISRRGGHGPGGRGGKKNDMRLNLLTTDQTVDTILTFAWIHHYTPNCSSRLL